MKPQTNDRSEEKKPFNASTARPDAPKETEQDQGKKLSNPVNEPKKAPGRNSEENLTEEDDENEEDETKTDNKAWQAGANSQPAKSSDRPNR